MSEEAAGAGGQPIARPNLAELWLLELMEMLESTAPPNASKEGLSGRFVFSQVSGTGLRSAREDAATEDALSLGGVNATRLRGVLEEATEGGGGRSVALPNAAEARLWRGEVLLRGGAAVVVNWATEELRAGRDAATGRDTTGLP